MKYFLNIILIYVTSKIVLQENRTRINIRRHFFFLDPENNLKNVSTSEKEYSKKFDIKNL